MDHSEVPYSPRFWGIRREERLVNDWVYEYEATVSGSFSVSESLANSSCRTA